MADIQDPYKFSKHSFRRFIGKNETLYRMKPNSTNKDCDPKCYQFFIANDTAPTAWWNFNKFVRTYVMYI